MGEAKRRAKSGIGGPARRFPGPTVPAGAPIKIENPLVIMFADDSGKVHCQLHPSDKCPSPAEYGLLIADLARHVARAFEVDEGEVWEWVDKERRRPTTGITNPS
jgi:hypothetical protein